MPQNTKIIFSSIVIHKTPQNIDKKVLELNSHLKNYGSLNNVYFIDTNNIKEGQLKVKLLHLIKSGNSVLASNLWNNLDPIFESNLPILSVLEQFI